MTFTNGDKWLRLFYYVTSGVLAAGLFIGLIETSLDIYQVWVGAATFTGAYLIHKFTKELKVA